jgi:hypothetical protein
MSPLENVQPAASSAAPAKPTSDAALAMRSAGAENAPPPRAAWSAIQRKGHMGSFDIFGADAAPAAPEPAQHEPPAAPVAPPAAALGTIVPRDLCLKDLRAACRERGINPGGGKEALEERLELAIASGAAAPIPDPRAATAPSENARGPREEEPRDASEAPRDASSLGKRPSSDPSDDDPSARRVASRRTNERSVVFAAPSPARPPPPLADAYKRHRADAFLADVLSSPAGAKRVATSDAKLRDLGVGSEVFAVGFERLDADGTTKAATEAAEAKAREAAGSGNLFGDVPRADAGSRPNEASKVTEAAAAKAREAKGSGDIFAADASADPNLGSRPEPSVPPALVPSHDIFAEEDPAGSSRAAAPFGGIAVSEAMKKSLFEGNRLFDAEAEAEAAARRATRDAAKDDEAARVAAKAHHRGHEIFGEDWVRPREEGEEEEEVEMKPAELARRSEKDRQKRAGSEEDSEEEVDDGFVPIGQGTPVVDLRWKTEEEEAAEEAVAAMVAEAVAKVIDRRDE